MYVCGVYLGFDYWFVIFWLNWNMKFGHWVSSEVESILEKIEKGKNMIKYTVLSQN